MEDPRGKNSPPISFPIRADCVSYRTPFSGLLHKGQKMYKVTPLTGSLCTTQRLTIYANWRTLTNHHNTELSLYFITITWASKYRFWQLLFFHGGPKTLEILIVALTFQLVLLYVLNFQRRFKRGGAPIAHQTGPPRGGCPSRVNERKTDMRAPLSATTRDVTNSCPTAWPRLTFRSYVRYIIGLTRVPSVPGRFRVGFNKKCAISSRPNSLGSLGPGEMINVSDGRRDFTTDRPTDRRITTINNK